MLTCGKVNARVRAGNLKQAHRVPSPAGDWEVVRNDLLKQGMYAKYYR